MIPRAQVRVLELAPGQSRQRLRRDQRPHRSLPQQAPGQSRQKLRRDQRPHRSLPQQEPGQSRQKLRRDLLRVPD